MIKISYKNNVSKKLEDIKKQLGNKINMSVSDACRQCSQVWKSLMPVDTGKSRSSINYVVKKNIGLVISPTHIKPNNFYLNQFLEGLYSGKQVISAGNTTRNIIGKRKYKLRSGIFGAGEVAAQLTKPFFKGLVTDRVRGVL